MRALVTGAAGFIGARVCEMLLEAGHELVGVDELNDAYDPRLKRHRLERLQKLPGFDFVEADVVDPSLAGRPELAGRFEAIVNLAARAGVRQSVEMPDVYVHTNVLGTLRLLEFARERAIPKFVLASTSSLYGAHNERPSREDADTSRPLSPYAATKGAAESLCHVWHTLYGLDVTVLRYFTVYGPAGRPDMSVFRFVQWIREERSLRLFGTGEESRDFTYVDDIARGTIAALRPLGYEVVNLGGDAPHQVSELIALLEARIGKRAQVLIEARHPADVPATWASIDKAERLLGWRPQISFAEGLAKTVYWYEAERDWAKNVGTD